MPLVKFVRGVVWNKASRSPGDVLDVSDHDAFVLCDGYKDAVRMDATTVEVKATGHIADVMQTRDPVAQHRDPVVPPPKRRGG